MKSPNVRIVCKVLLIGMLVLGACAEQPQKEPRTATVKPVVKETDIPPTQPVVKETDIPPTQPVVKETDIPPTQPVLPNPTYCAERQWATPVPAPRGNRFDLAISDHVIVVGPREPIDELHDVISGTSSLTIDIPEKYESEITRSMCPLSIALMLDEVNLGSFPALERTEAISLTYLSDVLDSCTAMPQHKSDWHEEIGIDPSLFSNWTMELWKIEGVDEWVAELSDLWGVAPSEIVPSAWVAAAFNCKGAELYGVPLVFADPTYRTGRVGGNPWSGAGGPWSGAGGSIADPDQASATFWEQWALRGEYGIGLARREQDAETWARRSDLPIGEGVMVGVFDAEPFGDPGAKDIGWIDPALELHVEHVGLLDQTEDSTAYTLSNHGLYVAGLIHAVAPGSDIHLYRVLDKNLKGDLWALNVALDAFIKEVRQQSDTKARNGAVINLSLGGRQTRDYSGLRWEVGPESLFTPPDPLETLVLLEVVSLKTLLSAAHCQGMVVVAAAGNDSYDTSYVRGPQIPAYFHEFIAVQASNSQGVQTCFTNQGDVAAPGGGSTSTAPCSIAQAAAGTPCCEPVFDRCPCEPGPECMEDCPYGLVGLVLPCGDYPSGYAYWAGTSFATPLVSGLTALVVEAKGPWPDLDVITSTIMLGSRPAPDANLSSGIIDVPCTILGDPCP